MKVVAFNGSPRKNGNTHLLINHVFEELGKEGIETEEVSFVGRKIQGCRACYKCFENKDGHCSVKDDFLNECLDKMVAADGILLGSPVYFADVTAEMKALIDRAGLVSMANGGLFKNKIGGSLAALRRTGGIYTTDSLNHFFLAMQMVIVGRGIAIGRNIGEVENDAEGIQLVTLLGQRMAWVMKKIVE
jgi:multimeric flavodoxin WrbA